MSKKEPLETLDDTLDWEYMSDYYTENENPMPLRTLEDYTKNLDSNKEMAESFTEAAVNDSKETIQFKQTIEDIQTIRTLSVEGHDIKTIAAKTKLDSEYITQILMTLEGYPEDNEIAVAHLILMQ